MRPSLGLSIQALIEFLESITELIKQQDRWVQNWTY